MVVREDIKIEQRSMAIEFFFSQAVDGRRSSQEESRENSSRRRSRTRIICQRCQETRRCPLRRIQFAAAKSGTCDYCTEWRRLEALLANVSQKQQDDLDGEVIIK